MTSDLISKERFHDLADRASAATTADHTLVRLTDRAGGTSRFANNQITQNVNTRRMALTISVAFGQKSGSAGTTDLSPESLEETLRRAERIAQVTPEDPEYLPPLPPQRFPILPTYREETAQVGPAERFERVRVATELCAAENLEAAGVVAAYTSAVGLAASSGLRAYEQRTRAEFSITATGPDSTGWAKNTRRSIDDLDVEAMTRRAIQKAKWSANPRAIPAGKMTAILEPSAVQGMVGPLIGNFHAKSYLRGTSALANRLGERIIDERLTLANRPDHPAALSSGFAFNGLPNDRQTYIDRGVFGRLNYDRFTAKEAKVAPTYGFDAVHLASTETAGETVEDLIASTARGVLVTNFWYIRYVNRRDITLTGMTRDGTFLVEDGQIVGGLFNFRWHESPLRAFNQLDACTSPTDAIATAGSKMILPAMRVGDFNFSSVSKF